MPRFQSVCTKDFDPSLLLEHFIDRTTNVGLEEESIERLPRGQNGDPTRVSFVSGSARELGCAVGRQCVFETLRQQMVLLLPFLRDHGFDRLADVGLIARPRGPDKSDE
jgi:hypothetical protein